MNLKKILTKDSILPELKADNKQGVIEEMVAFMAATGKLTGCESVVQAVLAREEKMSTGMQNGIAIPHGKTNKVDHLVAMMAIHRAGVEFASMDGNPSHIFIMTLSPENRAGPHIQFLAEISKALSRQELRESLLRAGSSDEIFDLLTAQVPA
ncbi:MAG TPA: PTS sugar transporter subunit IIA [Pontiellaceae bacterium]|nr:PTS sugar transporter subunit IIA [Pontiellaceae bacterium]HPR82849.1 PTS sugar transporter subunit IIA [Pontiellaceae bacterium]